MKLQKLLLILSFMLFSVGNIFAQNNDMKARIEFEDAETAFQNQEYEKAITLLTDAEKQLGKWSTKVSFLKVQALSKIINLDGTDYKWDNNVAELYSQVKKYMEYADKNPENVEMDRIREIIKIEKKVDYAKHVTEWRKMPEFKKAEEAIKNKDNVATVDWYKKAAAKNNAIAMLSLGRAYDNGYYDLTKSSTEAFKWYTKAAEKENRSALLEIAYKHFFGDGIDKNINEGLKYCKKAADLGNITAMLDLALIHSEGRYRGRTLDHFTLDEKEALKWYEKAGEASNYYGAIAVAEMYFFSNIGKSITKDKDKAFAWAKKAKELAKDEYGKGYSTYVMGRILQSKGQNNEAIQLYNEAVNHKSTDAYSQLGKIYYEGKIVTKSNKEALKWYELSAPHDYDDALLASEMYYYSDSHTDIIKDYNKALKLCNLAVERAYDDKKKAKSFYLLGRIKKSQKNYTEAMTAFLEAHKYGDTWAKESISLMYKEGLGVEKDKKKAKEWNKK